MDFWQVIPVSMVTALVTSIGTVFVAERKLRRDFRLEFAAESVARRLLMHRDWRLRSLRVIRHRLGGFSDDELRRILVRSGAIRFIGGSGDELWGLLERTESLLGVQRVDEDPASPDGPMKSAG
jgi:hypothetical protein